MKFETLTGKSAGEVIEIFRKHLPPSAYKPVPHFSFLTNIEPSYLVEALTEAFGPVGWGWSYRIASPIRIEAVQREGRNGPYQTNCATITDFELRYRFLLDDKLMQSDPIPSNGSSDNTDEGFAMKGAITSALGGAAKYLQWQIDIYKGQHKPEYERKSSETTGGGGSVQKTPSGQPGLRVITFGKHKGETLAEIAETDRGYVDWLSKNAKEPDVMADALAILEGPEPEKHWIMEKGENAKYYAKLKELGLNMKQGKEILVGAEGDMRKYPGSLEDAITVLTAHIE